MVKRILSLFFLMMLASCASTERPAPAEPTLAQFDLELQRQRQNLDQTGFSQWLESQRRLLESQREGIKGALYSTGERGSYQETMTSPMQSNGLNDFNVQMTNLEISRLKERLNLIERKLQTIDALESTLKEN